MNLPIKNDHLAAAYLRGARGFLQSAALAERLKATDSAQLYRTHAAAALRGAAAAQSNEGDNHA